MVFPQLGSPWGFSDQPMSRPGQIEKKPRAVQAVMKSVTSDGFSSG